MIGFNFATKKETLYLLNHSYSKITSFLGLDHTTVPCKRSPLIANNFTLYLQIETTNSPVDQQIAL